MSKLTEISCLTLTFIIAAPVWADEDIPLDQVPDAAIQAVRTEIPGINITEASIESENEMTVYELEGTADGMEYEIEVTADGRILEVEEDD